MTAVLSVEPTVLHRALDVCHRSSWAAGAPHPIVPAFEDHVALVWLDSRLERVILLTAHETDSTLFHWHERS